MRLPWYQHPIVQGTARLALIAGTAIAGFFATELRSMNQQVQSMKTTVDNIPALVATEILKVQSRLDQFQVQATSSLTNTETRLTSSITGLQSRIDSQARRLDVSDKNIDECRNRLASIEVQMAVMRTRLDGKQSGVQSLPY